MREKKAQAGFTLVELMVALTLFVIVVLAAVSSLYTVNNASRKVIAMRAVLDNLNFAVESMSRTIRTGDTFICGGSGNRPVQAAWNCTFDQGGDHEIMVHSTIYKDPSSGDDLDIDYKLDYDPDTGKGRIIKMTSPTGLDSWTTPVSITSPEIDVQNFGVYVDGSGDGDSKQPMVMLVVQGVASAGEQNVAPFSIQTLISQRTPEI